MVWVKSAAGTHWHWSERGGGWRRVGQLVQDQCLVVVSDVPTRHCTLLTADCIGALIHSLLDSSTGSQRISWYLPGAALVRRDQDHPCTATLNTTSPILWHFIASFDHWLVALISLDIINFSSNYSWLAQHSSKLYLCICLSVTNLYLGLVRFIEVFIKVHIGLSRFIWVSKWWVS